MYKQALDLTDIVRSNVTDGLSQDASAGCATVKSCASGAPLRGFGA